MAELENPWRQVTWRDIPKYDNSKPFARGSFSKLFRATLPAAWTYSRDVQRWPATELAIKELDHRSEQTEDMFRTEIDILDNTYHPCIGTIVAYDTTSYRYAMVYYNCSLRKVLKDDRKGLYPVWRDSEGTEWSWNENRCKCAFGIAAGLCYLHQKGIIHMGMSPENVMLDEQMRPKLVDFILALDRPTEEDILRRGIPAYMAPEMFCEGCHAYEACDVFAFGLIMYEILSGKQLPWVSEIYELCQDNPSNAERAMFICGRDITNPKCRPELNEYVFPEGWRDIITRCWDVDPRKRPTMAEICQMMADEKDFLLDEENPDEFRKYVEEVLPTLDL